MWICSVDNLYFIDLSQNGNTAVNRISLGKASKPTGLVSDPTGTLWLCGFGNLNRLRNGAIESVQPTEGLPDDDCDRHPIGPLRDPLEDR